MVRRLLIALAVLGFIPAVAQASALVAIDPGHGGGDPGAIGVLPPGTDTGMPARYDADGRTLLLEKDINLDVAFRLNHHLITRGYGTVLTRNTDNAGGDVPFTRERDDLQARVRIANNANADIFVSIHHNALPVTNASSTTVTGTETYRYSYSSPQSKALAEVLHRNLVAAMGLRDRGVKTANFLVLRETRMPAVLLEAGFLSNPQEARFLADPNVRQRMAESIGVGIEEYVAAGYRNPNPATRAAAQRVPTYQVNAGSFRRIKDARARLALTRKRGFKKTIIRSEWNSTLKRYMFVVRAGIFVDLNNAKSLRSTLRARKVPATIGGIPKVSHPVRVR